MERVTAIVKDPKLHNNQTKDEKNIHSIQLRK